MHGKWDGEIILQEKNVVDQAQKQAVFWHPTKQVIESRLKRFIVAYDDQMEFESEKLWLKVSEAIKNCDQNLATEEKTKIELKQREKDLERKSKFVEYKSKFFTYDNINKEWLYNYSDLRPWDNLTDFQFQYECDFRINTNTKHNLNKINAHTISDPHSSLLSLRHHHGQHSQTPRHHNRQSQMSNKEETAYDFLVYFNYVKQRLGKIEDSLKRLSNKLDESPAVVGQNQLMTRNHLASFDKDKLVRERDEYFSKYSTRMVLQNILKSPMILVFHVQAKKFSQHFLKLLL